MDVRRISRWGLNVLAGLSVVLCLATATLWVRSYWYYDQVRRTTERDDLSLNSYLGEVQLLAGLDVWLREAPHPVAKVP